MILSELRQDEMTKKKNKDKSSSPVESRDRVWLIFNDIKKSNFSINVEKVKELAIDSHQNVCLIINLVFEKATVSDKPRAQMYARLCQELQKIEVPDGNKPEKTYFGKLVISR